MTFTSVCEHLERRCGVAAPATLRARLLSVSIDPLTLDWGCVDCALMVSVQGNSGSTGGDVFHIDLLRTEFVLEGGWMDVAEISRLVDEALASDDVPESGPPLTAEQESLEAES